MQNSSRRDFLMRAAALAVGTQALSRPALLAASGPRIQFPTAPRERLAVASWPFRMFIDAPGNKRGRDPKQPGMDLKDFGAMVIQKFGVRNIEPLGSHFRSTEPAYIQEVREATEKAGSRIIDLPVGGRDSFYHPEAANRAQAVATSEKWIDIAAAVGSPSVRLHIAGVKDVKPDIPRAVESLQQLAEYAAGKNVVANLENDDNYTEDPFYIVEILEKVNNPYLRALPDFCNSMLTHDQEFNNRAMAAMFKHAYCIAHVKDSEVGDKDKLFTVDVAKCFEIAKAAGYHGYFSMEWEGAGEPYAGTQKLIDLSLKYLA
jgi:sugar phosphate isomerase/epimerase